MQEVSIFWFRRDLRIEDNAGLYHALKSNYAVMPIFIFDEDILSDLKEQKDELTTDKRVVFIYQSIQKLKEEFKKYDSDIFVFYGNVYEIWKQIIANYKVKEVYFNHDYEPYAIQRDNTITQYLLVNGIKSYSFKDHVIFEKNEILKDDNKPYCVYTPYSKKWKTTLSDFYTKPYPTNKYLKNLLKVATPKQLFSLETIGFKSIDVEFPTTEVENPLYINYPNTRDFPSVKGTSRLGLHLRFGTISIRKLVINSIAINAEKFLNELIWREFYIQILYHFPHVVQQSFRAEYDKINWRNNEEEYKAWCNGNTGYPIVDAGMRELNQTGYMHNRVRMIVASFLCKHLLIDWRWGEAYFAKKLLDFELASNNGSWQWCAGTGVDAAPYFRVFNPMLQTIKFDSKLEYIKKWVPELDSLTYAQPIVEHSFARKRCLDAYKVALEK